MLSSAFGAKEQNFQRCVPFSDETQFVHIDFCHVWREKGGFDFWEHHPGFEVCGRQHHVVGGDWCISQNRQPFEETLHENIEAASQDISQVKAWEEKGTKA